MNAIATPNVIKLAIFEVANAGVVAPINPITDARFAFAGSMNLNASIEVIKRAIHPPNPHKIALKVPPGDFCQEIVNVLSKIVIPIISRTNDPTVKCKYVCPSVMLTLVATKSNQTKHMTVITISFTWGFTFAIKCYYVVCDTKKIKKRRKIIFFLILRLFNSVL